MDSVIEIFAKRLKLARKRAKLSMDELCRRMEPTVSKQTVSKYEAGKCMPNGRIMIALARVLNVDIEYFTRPFDFDVEDICISFRKKSSIGAKELDALKVDVQDDIERYLEVESLLGIKSGTPQTLTTSNISTDDDMRRMAQLLRDKWGLGNNPILNVQELLESKGIKVILTKGPEGFDGVSGTIDSGSTRCAVIVINPLVTSCERKRLTALHELAHLLFNESFDNSLTEKRVEKLCNTFANEMLFPEDIAKSLFRGDRMIHLPELTHCQQSYGISIEAIVYKLHELNIINDARYKTFLIMKNKQPFMKQAVKASLFKEADSTRLEAMVYKAIAEGLVTKERAAVLLKQPLTDVEYKMESV